MALRLSTYCCGAPREGDGALRLGTVRYPPRGVRREDYARLDYFDLWFPLLAPSKGLLRAYKERPAGGATVDWFRREYLKEIRGSAEARQATALIRAVAERTPIALGCYCEDESACHRSMLHEELLKV